MTAGWVETAGLVAAIVFGSTALGTASWVWLRKQHFGYPGFILSLAGLLLLGYAIAPTRGPSTTAQASGGNSAEALQQIALRLGKVEQQMTGMEAGLQAVAASGGEVGDLKRALERVETIAAKLPDVHALQGQLADMQNTASRHAETLTQVLGDFDLQTKARLIALQASLDRLPSPSSPVRDARPAAAPVSRRSAPPAPVTRPASADTTVAAPVQPTAIIEPAAGPAAPEASFWTRWMRGGTDLIGTDGAEKRQ